MDNDFAFDVEIVKSRLEQSSSALPEVEEDDGLFAQALDQATNYEQAIEENINADMDAAPLEVRSAMNIFTMSDEFAEDTTALRLPQFVVPSDLPSFFSTEDTALLTRETLTQGFTLRDKDTEIDFTTVEAEIARVDIEENKMALPKAWKLRGTDNQYFREWFNSLSTDKRIAQCKSSILEQLSKINAVNDKDLAEYVGRVLDGLSAEQIEDLQHSPHIYCAKIKRKIDSLLTTHTERTFQLWIEQGKITCEPRYVFPKSISPLKFTSTLPRSLYTAEEEMNGLEKDVVWELANLPNIKWWHRNISRSGFNINGYINAFPDIIAMTNSGKILMIEPKGDHLENMESKQKAAVGKTWERMAGRDYRYYMVFKEKDLKHEGTVRFDMFLEIVKGL